MNDAASPILTFHAEEFSRLTLTPGTVYRYEASGQHYQICCVSRDVRTRQQMIVYLGIDGLDEGKYHHCTYKDFATRFTLQRPSQTATVAPLVSEMTVNLSETTGSGF